MRYWKKAKLASAVPLFMLVLVAALGADPAHALLELYGAANQTPDAASLPGIPALAGLSTLYKIDPTTGMSTAIGSGIGYYDVSGIDMDPISKTLYGVGFELQLDSSFIHKLITIDPSTGAGSAVGATGIATSSLDCGDGPGTCGELSVTDISFDSTGNLFAYLNSDALATIALLTGAATGIGFTGQSCTVAGTGSGIAFSGATLFQGCSTVLGSRLDTLDPGTAVSTPGNLVNFISPIDGMRLITAMDVNGGALYASVQDDFLGENYLVVLDPTTNPVGVPLASVVPLVDSVSSANLYIEAIAWVEVATVPEPGTLVLLGAGFALLAISRQKQG